MSILDQAMILHYQVLVDTPGLIPQIILETDLPQEARRVATEWAHFKNQFGTPGRVLIRGGGEDIAVYPFGGNVSFTR